MEYHNHNANDNDNDNDNDNHNANHHANHNDNDNPNPNHITYHSTSRTGKLEKLQQRRHVRLESVVDSRAHFAFLQGRVLVVVREKIVELGEVPIRAQNTFHERLSIQYPVAAVAVENSEQVESARLQNKNAGKTNNA